MAVVRTRSLQSWWDSDDDLREIAFVKELVASAPSRKNWRGMLIAIMVIMAVCGLIVTAVILMTPPDDGPRVKGESFSLEDVLGGKFKPRLFNGSWLQDNQLLLTDDSQSFQILDPVTGLFSPLVTNLSLSLPPNAKYSLSADKRFLLLSTNYKKVPGQPETFEVTVYDLTTGTVYFVPPADPDQRVAVQATVWSSSGSSLVYVHDNDVFFMADVTSGFSERITDNGAYNSLYNGVPDWTYRASGLLDKAVWFSASGDHLLFATFNESGVPEASLPLYAEPDSFYLYNERVVLKYPTPSSGIPKVSLRVVDLLSGSGSQRSSKELRPPLSLRDQEYYLTSVQWVSNQRVCAVWTIRSQNLSLISLCDAGPWHCQTVHTLEVGSQGWVDLDPSIHFSTDGNSFIHLAPVQVNEETFFKQIVMVDASKRHSWPITSGKLQVDKILAWDSTANFVYYLASGDQRTSDHHLFRTQLSSNRLVPNAIECLTCAVPARPTSLYLSRKKSSHESIFSAASNITSHHPQYFHGNATCQYSNAFLSPSFNFYVHECLGPSLPYIAVRSLPANKLVTIIQTNDELKDRAMGKAFPRIIKLKIPLPTKSKLPNAVAVELYMPPGLLEEEATSYPLVLLAPSSPGEIQVTDRWLVDWAFYMASNKQIIVAKVDSTGVSRLHEEPAVLLEAHDYAQLTKILQKTFPYISPVKTALVGREYGGYLSLLSLAKDTESVFGCGIAMTPISTWRMLAAPYAERYLGLLNSWNGRRIYMETDLSGYARNLQGKYVLLIHGTLEENIHAVHSYLLGKSMAQKNIHFQQQIYPDADENKLKENIHVYHVIDKFLDECFDRREPRPEMEKVLQKGD